MKRLVKDKEVISALCLDEPCEELQEWARKNIKEDPDRTCQLIQEFRDMIYSKGECTPIRMDDAFLLRFLRGRHFSLEGAHRLLVNYCNFREENPDYYKGAWISHLDRIGRLDIVVVPPYRDQLGRRMMLYKFGKWDPQCCTIDDVVTGTMILLELAILEPVGQILGGVGIIDLSNLSMQQVWHMNVGLAHKVIQIFVTSFPLKIQALHILHQSKVFDVVYNVFKPFLNERMKQRIFFHGNDMKSLHKHIDPKCLPEEYGGIHPSYDYSDWLDGFRKDTKIQEEMASLGYITDENENEKNSE